MFKFHITIDRDPPLFLKVFVKWIISGFLDIRQKQFLEYKGMMECYFSGFPLSRKETKGQNC